MDAFAARLLVSFVLGGVSVAAFTTIAERRGSRLGGLLLSFPVKVVISLALIGLNEGVPFAAEAAVAVPSGIAVNIVFLVATAFFVRRLRPWPALSCALAVWLLAGALAMLRPAWSPLSSVAYWLVAAALGLLLLGRIPGVRGERRSKRDPGPFGLGGLVGRAAGAGTVVAASVVLAHYGGPFLGGLASVFPSGWITTMVILTRRHGPEFTAATVRVMVMGSAAPALFGVTVALLTLPFGLLVGILAGLAAAGAASSAVGWALVRWDGKATRAATHSPESAEDAAAR